MWEGPSDGNDRSDDDVAAGGNAAVTPPTGYPGDEVDFGADGDDSSDESPTAPRDIAPATAASNELVEARRRVEERLPAMRDLNVSPLTVEELRAMTQGMTADQMNALVDSRALLKAKPMPKPKLQPAGRGTAQPGMIRMIGAYPKASAKTTSATPPQADRGSSRPTTAVGDAHHTAAALAAIHGLTTAMGALAGENNPSDHTTAAVAKASPEAAALFSGSRIEELNRANPRTCACPRGCRTLVYGREVFCDYCFAETDPQPRCDCGDCCGNTSQETRGQESGTATAASAATPNVQMSGKRFAAFTAYIRRNVDGRAIDNEETMAELFPELFQRGVPEDVDPDNLSDGRPDDYEPGHED